MGWQAVQEQSWLVGAMVKGSSFLWNSSKVQSTMRMMRCGGFPSLQIVEMSAALIVYRDDV